MLLLLWRCATGVVLEQNVRIFYLVKYLGSFFVGVSGIVSRFVGMCTTHDCDGGPAMPTYCKHLEIPEYGEHKHYIG